MVVFIISECNLNVYRDTDSYAVFAEFFDPVIEEYHRGFKPTDKHITDMNVDHLKGNISEPEKIISTRIRVARNITGFNLAPGLVFLHQRFSLSLILRNHQFNHSLVLQDKTAKMKS